MHSYIRPEEPSDRESRVEFFSLLRCRSQYDWLTGLPQIGTHTAAYQPFRRHSSRGGPPDPAEAAPSAWGLPRHGGPVGPSHRLGGRRPPPRRRRVLAICLDAIVPYEDAGESNPVASMASSISSSPAVTATGVR